MANYWLMKSEPEVFSFLDLKTKGKTRWDGVRNYQARNYMTKEMNRGDLVFFYHSNAEPSGVAGIAQVSGAAQPDSTAFDKKSPYYDAKSTTENPRWFCVEVSFKADLPRFISLEEIKGQAKLQKMVLLNNSRLSVQPVSEKDFKYICQMAESAKPKR